MLGVGAPMRGFLIVLVSVCLIGASTNRGSAQDSRTDVLKSLNYQHGRVNIGDSLATLNLTRNFAYLNAHDTEIIWPRQ
jgi:hypothetical protein